MALSNFISMTRSRAKAFLLIPNVNFFVVTHRDPANPWIIAESTDERSELCIVRGFPLGDGRPQRVGGFNSIAVVIKTVWPDEPVGAVLTLEAAPDRVEFELHPFGTDLDKLVDAGKYPQGVYDPVEWLGGHLLRPMRVRPVKQSHLAAPRRLVKA